MKKLKIAYLFWKLKRIESKIMLSFTCSKITDDLKLAEDLRNALYEAKNEILKKLSILVRA